MRQLLYYSRSLFAVFGLLALMNSAAFAQESESCPAPTGVFVQGVAARSANINWNLVDSANIYEVNYKVNGPDQPWLEVPGAWYPPFSLTGILPGTIYQVRVRSVCADNFSEWSDTTGFQTDQSNETCLPPGNILATSVFESTASLFWIFPPNASQAELSYRPTGNESIDWTVVEGIDRFNYDLVGLTPSTQYEFRLRSVCPDKLSEYSQVTRFTTLGTAPCPTPTFSLIDTTSSSVRVTWDQELPAWEIGIRTLGSSGAFNNVQGDLPPPYTFIDLLPSTTYQVRMRRNCGSNFSSFTTVQEFTTDSEIPPCDIPTISIGEVLDFSAEINWLPDDLNGYILSYRQVGAPDWNTVTNSTPPPLVLDNLQPETTYEVKMQHTCLTAVSEESEVRTFTTQAEINPCNPPASVEISSISDVTAFASWDGALDAWELDYRATGTANWVTIPGSDDPPYQITGLSPGGAYEVRLRQICPDKESEYTNITTFSTFLQPPACLGPTISLEQVSNTSVTIAFTPEMSRYEISYKPENANTFSRILDSTASPYTITGFTAQQNYELRMVQICDGFSSTTSNTLRFFTQTPPPCPTPALQLGAVTKESISVSWTPVSLENYQINYREQGTEEWTVRSGSGTGPFVIENLESLTTYEIRLRQNCEGRFSDFSETLVVQTESACPTPAFFPQTVEANYIDLFWTQPYDRYEFSYRPEGAPTWTTVPENAPPPYRIEGLLPETVYKIRMRRNCDGINSLYSDTLSVETLTPCDVPVVFVADVGDVSAQISWVPELLSYDIEFKMVADTEWTVIPGAEPAPYDLTFLEPGTTYEVRMRQLCDERASDYSTSVQFTTDPPAPSCDPPGFTISNVEDIQARINWTPAEGGQSYEVSYRMLGTFNWTTVPIIGANTYVIQPLVRSTIYEVRMRQVCQNGLTSDYTEITRFATLADPPPCPIPAVSVYRIADNAVTVNWSPVTEIYEFGYRRKGTQNWITALMATPPPYRFTGIRPDTEYELRIRNYCNPRSGYSLHSDIQEFRTMPLQPVCPIPDNIQITDITPTTALISWNASEEADSFEVSLSDDNGFSFFQLPVASSRTIQAVGLNPETTYTVALRSFCGTKISEYSATPQFDTPLTEDCPAPFNLAVANAEFGQATISWLILNDIDYYEIEYSLDMGATWESFNSTTTPPLTITGLIPDTTYMMRLRSFCDGRWSDFSNSIEFYTGDESLICNAPSIGLASVGADTAVIDWDIEMEVFEFGYRIADAQEWTTLNRNGVDSVVLRNLTPGTDYQVRIRQVCENNFSVFSNLLEFATDTLPADTSDNGDGDGNEEPEPDCSFVPTLSVESVSDNSVRVSWTPDVNTYELSYRVDGESQWNAITETAPPPYIITGLFSATNYQTRMRQVCDDEFSVYSNVASFETRADAIPCVQPVLFVRQVGARSAEVAWNPTSGLAYEVSYKLPTENDWTEASITALSPFTINGLSPDTEYQVRVRQDCDEEFSDFSNIGVFRTLEEAQACQAPVAELLNVSLTSATIRWDIAMPVYEVSYRPEGQTSWITFTNTSPSPIIINNLNPEARYELRIRQDCGPEFSPYSNLVEFITTDAQVDCPAPAQPVAQGITENSAEINWQTSDPADSYELSYTGNDGLTWTSVSNLDEPPYLLEGLASGRRYFIRLRNVCNGQFSPNSNTADFTTLQSGELPCAAPELTVGSVDSSTAELNWNISMTSYVVGYRETGDPNWILQQGTEAPPFMLEGLEPDTEYEVRLQQVCGTELSSFSNVENFFTELTGDGGCARPSIQLTDITTNSVRINWTQDLQEYEIEYRAEGMDNWTTITAVMQPPYILTDLLSNTNYELRMRQRCGGDFSGYSTLETFATLVPQSGCNAPTLSVLDASATSAVLTWQQDFANFELSVRSSGGNWRVVATSGAKPFSVEGLSPGTFYSARMRRNCAGTLSAYSETVTFITAAGSNGCDAPELTLGTVTGNSASVSWTPQTDAFELSYREEGSDRWTVVNGQNASSFELTDLNQDTDYYVLLRRRCNDNFSPYSQQLGFKTQAIAVNCERPTILAANATGTTATLVFDARLDSFELTYRRNGTATWQFARGSSADRVTLTGLEPNTTYFAIMRRVCANGIVSDFSNQLTFNTQGEEQACVTPILTISEVSDKTATLIWDRPYDNYEISYRDGNNGAWRSLVDTLDPPFVIQNLRPETLYYVRMRQLCSSGPSAFTEVLSFVTQEEAPPAPCDQPFIQTGEVADFTVDILWSQPYQIMEISYRTASTDRWTIVETAQQGAYRIEGLSSNTTYYIITRQRCGDRFSNYSNMLTVRTNASPDDCIQPTNFNVGNVTDQGALTTWNGGSDIIEVSFREVGAERWTVFYQTRLKEFQIRNLAPGTDYEARARSFCGNVYSNFTQVRTFTTLQNRTGAQSESAASLSVYPNPSRGAFTVNLNAPKAAVAEIELFDVSGKRAYIEEAYLTEGKNNIPIMLPADLKGLFFLKISAEGVAETAKIIVQ